LEVIDGSVIENVVCTMLKGYGTLKYYRTLSNAEIDFIIETPTALVPIEVKFRNKV
jgi:Holliday junction resolvase-like predicted endonuclease